MYLELSQQKNHLRNQSIEISINFKRFFKGLISLIRNPTFVLLTLTGCIQNLLLTGSSSFIAKYYEQSLNMTTENSGYTFGEYL